MQNSFPECHGLVCVASEFVPSYYILQAEENSQLLLNHDVPVCHNEASFIQCKATSELSASRCIVKQLSNLKP